MVVHLTACTTYRAVPVSSGAGPVAADRPPAQLAVRDFVEVRTRDGRSHSLEVTALDDRGLAGRSRGNGEAVTLAWDDIVQLSVVEVDAARTGALVLAVVAVMYAVARVVYNGFVDRN